MMTQDLNSRTVTITDFRRDVDSLTNVLEKDGEVYVTKNNQVMFVAVDPFEYQKKRSPKPLSQVIAEIDEIRKGHKNVSGKSVGDFVADMRNERARRWTK